MSIQVRIDKDAAPLLDELTSPWGKGKLLSGLLRAADERRRAMEAGQAVPYDMLTRVLVEEKDRRTRSLKRDATKSEE